jgi:H+/Cl- antiporter ClcA
MIDPQANPKSYIKLLAFVVVLGFLSALVTFVFMGLVHVGTGAIWEQAAGALGLDTRLFTILICTIGGLLVGLLVKLFGDHNAIFADLMLEFGKTGRFNYRHAPASSSPPSCRSSPVPASAPKRPWRTPAAAWAL